MVFFLASGYGIPVIIVFWLYENKHNARPRLNRTRQNGQDKTDNKAMATTKTDK